MAYIPNIPQPEDQMNDSQGEMLANFIQLNTAFGVNHVNFNGADQGKHNMLSMPYQYNPPALLADESLMMCILSGFTNRGELVYRDTAAPLDNKLFTQRETPLQRFPGWATLAGSSLIMKWGQCTAIGFSIFAFPDDNGASIPRFTNPPYAMILSPISADPQDGDVWIRLIGAQARTFSCFASSRTQVAAVENVTFYYLAIGN